MTESVKVTQADRGAAASLWAERVSCGSEWYAIREGRRDAGEYVQAFARHRIAAQPEREAVLSADNANLAKELEAVITGSCYGGVVKVSISGDLRDRILAALTTPAPTSEREAVLEEALLEIRDASWPDVDATTGVSRIKAFAAKTLTALKTTPAPAVSTDELERLVAHVREGGPHEWGYRDVTDGTFIADDWPFDAAAFLSRLRGEGG